MINYKTLGKFAGKAAIALLIVACAYLFGRYQANNACKTKALTEEAKQSKQALNGFVESAQVATLFTVGIISATNKIGESNNASKTEYIKIIEHVPTDSDCVIDSDRLRILNDAITKANATAAGSVPFGASRSKAN